MHLSQTCHTGYSRHNQPRRFQTTDITGLFGFPLCELALICGQRGLITRRSVVQFHPSPPRHHPEPSGEIQGGSFFAFKTVSCDETLSDGVWLNPLTAGILRGQHMPWNRYTFGVAPDSPHCFKNQKHQNNGQDSTAIRWCRPVLGSLSEGWQMVALQVPLCWQGEAHLARVTGRYSSCCRPKRIRKREPSPKDRYSESYLGHNNGERPFFRHTSTKSSISATPTHMTLSAPPQ